MAEQGELKIKFVYCSKTSDEHNYFWNQPFGTKSNAYTINVDFALANYQTQNFSMPINSGTFQFRYTTMNKRVSEANIGIDSLRTID